MRYNTLDDCSDNISDDKLTSFISTLCYQANVNPNYKRIILTKGLLSLLGCFAGVPFANASKNAAGPYTTLSYFFASGTVIAFGAGAIWVFHRIVDTFTSKSKAENEILELDVKFNCIKYFSIISLSSITTVIPVFTAYKYNDVKVLTLITIPISFAFNVFGFYNISIMFSHLISLKCNANDNDSKKMIKKMLGYILYTSVPTLYSMDGKAVQSYHDELFPTDDFSVAQFILTLRANNAIYFKTIAKKFYNGIPRFATQALILCFPFLKAYVNYRLATEVSLLLSDNKYIVNLFTLLVVTPILVVDSIVTLKTAGNIFDKFFNRLAKNPTTNLLSKRHPKLTNLFTLVAIIFGLLSSSNSAYVTYTTLDHDNLFFTICSIISSTIFESFAQKELYNNAYDLWVMHYGNINDKNILMVDKKLNHIVNVIANVNPKHWNQFIHNNHKEISYLLTPSESIKMHTMLTTNAMEEKKIDNSLKQAKTVKHKSFCAKLFRQHKSQYDEDDSKIDSSYLSCTIV